MVDDFRAVRRLLVFGEGYGKKPRTLAQLGRFFDFYRGGTR